MRYVNKVIIIFNVVWGGGGGANVFIFYFFIIIIALCSFSFSFFFFLLFFVFFVFLFFCDRLGNSHLTWGLFSYIAFYINPRRYIVKKNNRRERFKK